ncbi:MAG: restriction endonuclease subunit S [Bacteroidota bacterium]
MKNNIANNQKSLEQSVNQPAERKSGDKELKGWRECKLGDVAMIKGGKRLPHGKDLSKIPNNHPYIRTKDIVNHKILINELLFVPDDVFPSISQYTVEKDDIIISIVGTIGSCAIIPKELHLANLTENCAKITEISEDEAFPKFIFYYLISPSGQEEILQRNVGSTQPKLPLYNLRDIHILLPPLPEQKAIAAVLSSLDDKIDLLHRQNKTLEAMAETLFRQWFVEPCKNGLPEGWEMETFSKWILETYGGDWGKENAVGEYKKAVNCIRGTDIADLNIGIPTKTPIRYLKEEKYKSICPREGDLIMEISGGTENQSTGRTCYINSQIEKLFDNPLSFSNFCRLIRLKKTDYTYFMYCYIQYLYKQDEFFSFENGSSGIKNLNYKAILFEIFYPTPEEKIIIEFQYFVKPIFDKIDQNKIQIRTLEKLRDLLLPRLISGEIRVRYE